MNSRLIFVFFLFFLVLTLSSVHAEVPQNYQQLYTGMELKIPQDNILTVNQDYDFYIHPYDIATGMSITSKATCTIWLYNQSGMEFYNETNTYVIGAGGDNFHFFITGGNFSTPGDYYYNVECDDSTIGGFASSLITVLPSTESNTLFFLILALTAVLLLIIAFIFKNTIFAFISGLTFLTTGVYSIIYGFGNFTNTYTQMLSLIIIGFGAILLIISALDFINENSENESSIESED
jgi:hypothetical protein